MTDSARSELEEWAMPPFPTMSHIELQDLASATRAAAHCGDARQVEACALHLFETLVDHVLAERPAFLQLAPADSRLLTSGQRRIVAATSRPPTER